MLRGMKAQDLMYSEWIYGIYKNVQIFRNTCEMNALLSPIPKPSMQSEKVCGSLKLPRDPEKLNSNA